MLVTVIAGSLRARLRSIPVAAWHPVSTVAVKSCHLFPLANVADGQDSHIYARMSTGATQLLGRSHFLVRFCMRGSHLGVLADTQ
jgi:hypothetical protein